MTKKWITHSTDGRNIAAMVDAPWVYDVSLISMYKSKPGTYIIQLAGVQSPEPTKTQVFLCKSLRAKMKPNCFRMIVRKGKEAKFGALNKMCNREFEERAQKLIEAVKWTEVTHEEEQEEEEFKIEEVNGWGRKMLEIQKNKQKQIEREKKRKKEKQKKQFEKEMTSMPSFDELLNQMKQDSSSTHI